DYGLILDYFLFCTDAFRIAPPLIISEEDTIHACMQIKKMLDDIVKN
ncbi:MAG: aspartate aminotransferase family protein, partial [Bacteroidia bacterium]|nr:aspartate aminotransferase family protein [Bacteroidia bacterium]